jgi:hypothetical protein
MSAPQEALSMTVNQDPLVGTWVLDPSRSTLDPNHRPRAATLVIGRDEQGRYTIAAEGIGENGQPVAERPQVVAADGQPHPVPDFPGLTTISTCPDARTLHTDVRREDGSIAAQSTFVVAPDRLSLAATNSGFDSQLRQFTQQTVWSRGAI